MTGAAQRRAIDGPSDRTARDGVEREVLIMTARFGIVDWRHDSLNGDLFIGGERGVGRRKSPGIQ
jgi:hypothetical protein